MNFHKFRLLIKNFYTLENVVLAVAVLIALGWVWGTMDTLQNNFRLQAQVNNLRQEVEQDTLKAQNLALENQYYASAEYQELEARERLGKAAPGEHMLLLPANTVSDSQASQTQTPKQQAPSNFQAWLNFFFGNRS
jgi:cell division protein FtsB